MQSPHITVSYARAAHDESEIWWTEWTLKPPLYLGGAAPDPLLALAIVLADLCEEAYDVV